MATIGVRLNNLLEEKGLSYSAVARQLGVSRQTIGAWISGKANPTHDRLVELAAFLEVPASVLMGEEGTIQPVDSARAFKHFIRMERAPNGDVVLTIRYNERLHRAVERAVDACRKTNDRESTSAIECLSAGLMALNFREESDSSDNPT